MKYRIRNILMKAMAKITRHPRYRPEFFERNKKTKWTKDVYIQNIFRAYEWLFGREYGIRPEAETQAFFFDDKLVVRYKLHTLEAIFTHIESTIRGYFDFKKFFYYPPSPAYSRVALNFGVFGLIFNLDLPFRLLPLFGLTIAVEDTSTGTASSETNISFSHVVSGSNTVLVAMFHESASSGSTSGTYNGDALTLQTSAEIRQGSAYSAILTRVAPDAGTNTLVLTAISVFGRAGEAITFSGADQTTQPDAVAEESGTNSGTSHSNVLNITTVADNSYIVDAISINGSFINGGPTPDGSQTTVVSAVAYYSNDYGASSYKDPGTAGAKTMTEAWTTSFSFSTAYAHVGISITPAAGGGGSVVKDLISPGLIPFAR